MSENVLHKLTLYKLNDKKIDKIDVPGYKHVSKGSWSESEKTYPYRLFIYRDGPKAVAWMSVFKPLGLKLEHRDIPATIISGFILIVQVGSTLYAITGGIGHLSLRKSLSIEFRFGIDLAEKMLALPELRGLSQKDTGGVVNLLARGFRGIYNPQGDISNLKRVLTNVRGTLKKQNPYYEKIGCSIQASDALVVSGRKSFKDIIRFVIEVDKLDSRGSRKISIPQLEHINRKAHTDLLDNLEACLVNKLSRYDPDKDQTLFLDNEDIGYLADRATKYLLSMGRQKYEMANYESVFRKVRGLLSNIDLEEERRKAFRRMSLKITYDDGPFEERSLMSLICGDVEYEDDVYFIVNQKWYRASSEYIEAMNTEIDNIEYLDPSDLGMQEWDDSKHREEKDFNDAHSELIVLDRKLIKIPDEKSDIEFCDLLKVNEKDIFLIHVKRASGAALRALFAQGFVSSKLYSESELFRRKLFACELSNKEKLSQRDKKIIETLNLRRKHEMKVVYAIYDDKKTHKVNARAKTTSDVFNKTLTVFARVDLLDRVTNLRAMGYDVSVTRIRPYPC